MENLIIEKVLSTDVEGLQKISRDTFSETFSDTNAAEDMAHYLENSLSINKLAEEIANDSSQFYFAVLNSEVIGYLKINTGNAQTELLDEHALEIERIYVLKAYHGKNIGQLLYSYALDMAQKRNASYVWLGVWEHNVRAISFYTKNGFVPFDKHVFWLGNDKQTDILMKKIL